eukprot:COSAG04_NODE_7679_length_1088_cov_1.224469_1_plen_166_part_00
MAEGGGRRVLARWQSKITRAAAFFFFPFAFLRPCLPRTAAWIFDAASSSVSSFFFFFLPFFPFFSLGASSSLGCSTSAGSAPLGSAMAQLRRPSYSQCCPIASARSSKVAQLDRAVLGRRAPVQGVTYYTLYQQLRADSSLWPRAHHPRTARLHRSALAVGAFDL